MTKTIVGLTEKIKIKDNIITAKIDTGATMSSIHIRLAAKLELGPLLPATKRYKNVHGSKSRALVKVSFKIKNRKMNFTFNIVDRKEMKYKVLIGQNILKKNFLIDPSKK